MVIGRVLGVYIDDGVLKNGKIDLGMTQPIARLGYYDYCVVKPESTFSMVIPGDAKQGGGLEGSTKKNRELVQGVSTVKDGEEEDAVGQLKRVQSQDVIAGED